MIREERIDVLYRYSPFSVDRKIDKTLVIEEFVSVLQGYKIYEVNNNHESIKFFYNENFWETAYFGFNAIELAYVDYPAENHRLLIDAITSFISFIKNHFSNNYIIKIELPSEDIQLIQALNHNRFRTIETRLYYYNNNLGSFDYDRFKVRDADEGDISNLMDIAKNMRNEFDRFHADWSINENKADQYLSTYVRNSINGFADIILVPAELNTPADSFLTANIQKKSWQNLNYNISKMVLSAVSSHSNRGWYKKLIIEMTYRLQKEGAVSIFMNTQATNVPVFIVWQNLGYKLGRATYLLSLSGF